MKILGSQQDIKEKQQALAQEFTGSPYYKGQAVAGGGSEVTVPDGKTAKEKELYMEDVSLDFSSPEVNYSLENMSNRKKRLMEKAYSSWVICMLWTAFALIVICTVGFLIACASLYVHSPRKMPGIHVVNVYENLTQGAMMGDLNASTEKPIDIFKIDFKIGFSEDITAPPSGPSSAEPSEDPFEETLRKEIHEELSGPESKNDGFDRVPFNGNSTKADDRADFIPVLRKDLQKSPSIMDMINFVKRLLHTEEFIFKTKF